MISYTAEIYTYETLQKSKCNTMTLFLNIVYIGRVTHNVTPRNTMKLLLMQVGLHKWSIECSQNIIICNFQECS